MRATTYDAPTDWLEFDDPSDKQQVWNVHIGFLMSNWECIYGRGCPGCIGKDDKHTQPDMGCCGHGAYLNSRSECDSLQAKVDTMTEEDLGPNGLAYIRKNGWFNSFNENIPDQPDKINRKTKVRDGGCVLAKRAGDGNSKTGCAFLLQNARENKVGITEVEHVDVSPEVCWQLPIAQKHEWLSETEVMTTIYPWDSDYWGGTDPDGTHDSWMQYWCTDTADAYIGNSHLYLTMEKELRKIMGDPGYEMLVKLLGERKDNVINPMPGSVRNGGRPLLPLIVNGRTPLRVATQTK